MRWRSTPIDLVSIALVASLVRLAAFLQLRDTPFTRVPILDEQLYHGWALEISSGSWLGEGVFFANPLYAYFLGAVYALSDGSTDVARLLQHGLGVVTCLLVYAIGRRAFGRAAGYAAGLLGALYLPFIAFGDTLLIATLGVALVATALWAALRADASGRAIAWAAAGLVAGLGLLARPTALPLAVLVWALWPVAGTTLARRVGSRALPYLLGVSLAVLPVTVRNVVVGGEFAWITAHAGETFYVGNRPGADGSNRQPDFVRSGPRFEHEDYRREASRLAGRELTLPESSAYWRGRALDFMATQPLDYARLVGKKLRLLVNDYEKGDNIDLDVRRELVPLYRWPWPGFGVVLALGAVGWLMLGLRRTRRLASFVPATTGDDRAIRLLWLTALAVAVGVLVYFVTARYRLPLVVPLLPLAGHAIAGLWASLRQRPVAALLPAAALACLLALAHAPLARSDRNDAATSSINVGYQLERVDDLEQALVWYRRAARLAPANPLAHFNVGTAERRGGNLEQAAVALERAVALDSTYTDALNQLGMTREQAGDHDAALALYRRALRLEPNRARHYRDLGRLHLLRGEATAAAQMWQRAVQLDPGDVRTRDRLIALIQALQEEAAARDRDASGP